MRMISAASRILSFKLNGLVFLLLSSLALPAFAQQKALTDCQNITDRTARFACYDQAETTKAVIPKGATQSTIPARLPSATETTAVTTSPSQGSSTSSSASVSTVPAEAAKKPFYRKLWPFGSDEPSDSQNAKAVATKAPAKPGNDVDNFGRSASASVSTDSGGVKELTDTIASLKQSKPNMWRITLASGQVWQQAMSGTYLLQPGEKITIRPSGWGSSYRLYSERLGSFIQVDRVN